MADQKITALTAHTAPVAADVLPIVSSASGATRKITYAKMIEHPYAMLASTETQTIASATTAQVITFNTNEALSGITHSTSVNPSRVQIDTAGTYLVTMSAIANVASGVANQKINIWLAVDGSSVARSNTIVALTSVNQEFTLAVSFIYTFTAAQYFELLMSGSATTVRILATAAQTGPVRPACPSIIMTVNRISS